MSARPSPAAIVLLPGIIPACMRLLALCLIVMALTPSSRAQDYERERRWADEIVPSLVVGDAVQLTLGDGPGRGRTFLGLWTPAANPRGGVVLVHGVGVHPDHGVIGALRMRLADAGYSTLAIQMPVQGKEASVDDYYPGVFPEAGNRIATAARWIREKGVARPVLLSHSMGAWMSNVHLLESPGDGFAAWMCLGITGRISGAWRLPVPVLDVYGEQDLPPARDRAFLRRLELLFAPAGSRQVMIPGADHHYTGREDALTAALLEFLAALR